VLLRKLSDKRNWDWIAEVPSWVPSGAIPAAPLGCFNSSHDSKISVWYIENDKSNLERIIAGIAAGRQNADKFDYILFPDNVLSEAEVKSEEAPGKSKDDNANAKWHRDLIEISATKLVKLVELVSRQGEINRFSEREVISLIRKSVDDGAIEKRRLHENLSRRVFEN
jgi:hypothetical protein